LSKNTKPTRSHNVPSPRQRRCVPVYDREGRLVGRLDVLKAKRVVAVSPSCSRIPGLDETRAGELTELLRVRGPRGDTYFLADRSWSWPCSEDEAKYGTVTLLDNVEAIEWVLENVADHTPVVWDDVEGDPRRPEDVLVELRLDYTDFTPPADADADDGDPVEKCVTLDQMAAIVNRSKRTLEHYVNGPGMPQPDVEGGGGKPNEWKWSRAKPWLEKTFGRKLPEKYLDPGPSVGRVRPGRS
jgi:hypothetical protein